MATRTMPTDRRIADYATVYLDAMVIIALAEGGLSRVVTTYLTGKIRTTTLVREEVFHKRYVTAARRVLVDERVHSRAWNWTDRAKHDSVMQRRVRELDS